ncbi:MAG: hypothetical protein MTP17_00935 [Candidatus Midichloria sp.]|nr:MAG: hypothetical protein MTP17_00935 [Candidatus Midichloria sp.]
MTENFERIHRSNLAGME